MSCKIVFILCAQMLIQSISTQCIGTIGAPLLAAPLAAGPCGNAWGTPYAGADWAYGPVASLAASNGPGMAVATSSPLIPAGVSVLSSNAYEGILAVGGAVPFVGTAAIEGALPTAGAGAVDYGCGNGAVAVTAEDVGGVVFNDMAGPLGYGTIGTALTAAPMAVSPMPVAPMIAAPLAGAPLAMAPCVEPWGVADNVASLAASNGPGVAVSTASPIVPAGVAVLSENAYEGALAVGGAMPFLGTVALEGVLPTAGAGAVSYGCGNGAVGITAEDIGAVGFGMAGPLGYGAGFAGPLGYGPALAGPMGIAGPGCGCGVMY